MAQDPGGRTPLIAVHGVGNHKAGDIARALEESLSKAGTAADVSVSEFNWDQHVEQSRWISKPDDFWALRKTSSNLVAMAQLSIRPISAGFDALLARIQSVLLTGLTYLIAISCAIVVSSPGLAIMVFLPIAMMFMKQVTTVGQILAKLVALAPYLLAMVMSVVGMLLALGTIRSVLGTSRVPATGSLVGAALALINPLAILLSIPLTVNWLIIGGAIAVVSGFGLIASTFTTFFSSEHFFSVWDDFGYDLSLYFLFILALIGALAGIQLAAGRLWHEGPLKILLDIARYVGEPEYRLKTLRLMSSEIESRTSAADTVILVAHSLGSIIALDYLHNWGEPVSRKHILLVTLGSPYRRFFLRALPSQLLPRRTEALAHGIATRHASFRWLNVYRPLDYVGMSLGLGRKGLGRDVCTWQWLRLNGHGNYWGDRYVRARIQENWRSLEALEARSEAIDVDPTFVIPESSEEHDETGDYPGVTASVIGVLIAVACLICAFFGQHAYLWSETTSYEETSATVEHRLIGDASGQGNYAHEFTFFSEGESPVVVQLSHLVPASFSQRQFDHRRLEDFIRSDCTFEHEPRWYESDDSVPCTSSKPVRVRRIKSEASDVHITLPDFKPAFYLRDILGWTLYPVLIIGLVLLPTYPFMRLAERTFGVLAARAATAPGKPRRSAS